MGWIATYSALVRSHLKSRTVITCTNHLRYAIANTLIGVVLFYVIGCSALHFSGAWYAEFLPMSDPNTYDNTGAAYNTSRVLNKDFTLDEEAYENYSPLFIRYVFV